VIVRAGLPVGDARERPRHDAADEGVLPGPRERPGEGTGTERESDTESDPEGPPPADAVEPARSTFTWSPDGGSCAECGERVEERWESDPGLVCVECKSW
jgi:hypothetical protein